MVRLVNYSGEAQQANVRTDFAVREASRMNLSEETLGDVSFQAVAGADAAKDGAVRIGLELGPKKIETLGVEFRQ